MVLHATRFELVMNAARGRLVRLGADDFGLYGPRGFRNAFGTPLMARGTRAELVAVVRPQPATQP
jgi:hypothetical protein